MKHILNLHRSLTTRAILSLTLLAISGQRDLLAEVISSPLGNFQVGIDELGNLYDTVAEVGFKRVVDGYDPIRPLTPRESYGVSAGALKGIVDPNNDPGNIQNMVLVGESFLPTTASKSTVLRVAGVDLLRIDQEYSWAAENVLQIATTISNLSDSLQAVLFSRNVDWDIAPSETDETITASALALPVIDGSFDGFENPDPLAPFVVPTGVAGGFFGPGDLGAGLRIDLGSLQPAGAPDEQDLTRFSIFYAIGGVGQNEAQLRAQLGFTGGTNRSNTAALGFAVGSALAPTTLISGAASVPEPTSVSLLAVGAIAALVCAIGCNVRQKLCGVMES